MEEGTQYMLTMTEPFAHGGIVKKFDNEGYKVHYRSAKDLSNSRIKHRSSPYDETNICRTKHRIITNCNKSQNSSQLIG